MKTPALIAIDWGTTNLRAYLLDKESHILESTFKPYGISKLSQKDFPSIYTKITTPWLTAHSVPVIMSGMIGSRNGWLEIDYLPYTSPLRLLAHSLQQPPTIANAPYIVPGIRFNTKNWVDVMRGEETEVFGAITQNCNTFCVPGTHSKWIKTQNEYIIEFTTFLSGELYKVLSKHSLLKKQIKKTLPNNKVFLEGVAQIKNNKGMLANLFNIRAKILFNQLNSQHVMDYLSGLIVGYELIESKNYWDSAKEIIIIGEEKIINRYQLALSQFDKISTTLPSKIAVTKGLWKIAKLAQII